MSVHFMPFQATFLSADGVTLDERGRYRLSRNDVGYLPKGELWSAPCDLGRPKSVALNWVAQWTAPLKWEKYTQNPVFGPDKTGAWDGWTNGVSIVPTADGKTYRMYYAGRGAGQTSGGIGFAEAPVSDPTHWTENPASPVLVPRTDNWEGGKINQPRVVKVTDTHWRMYYGGWGFPGPRPPAPAPGTSWALGLAESFDGGTTWTRFQEAPILNRGGADSYDGGAAVVPTVLRVGDTWMMWYTAASGVVPKPWNIYLALATSKDGIHWEKHAENPVLNDLTYPPNLPPDFKPEPFPRSTSSRCYVRHDDGVFRMWYSHGNGEIDYRIRYAESLDGIHWERAPVVPVLDVSPAPAWDDRRAEYPEVQVVDGTFRLWFCGNPFGSVGYATGVPETGVGLSFRSGDTPQLDATWTTWQEATRGQKVPVRRYLQVRAALWSKNPAISPALNWVSVE